PVGAVCVLTCLLIAVFRDLEDGPGAYALLGGLALLMLADVVYAALLLQDRYVTGHPVGVVRFGALVLLGMAAARERTDVARWRAERIGASVNSASAPASSSSVVVRAAVRAASRTPSLRSVTPAGSRALVRGPVWRYLTPAVLLTLATLVVVIVSLQRG